MPKTVPLPRMDPYSRHVLDLRRRFCYSGFAWTGACTSCYRLFSSATACFSVPIGSKRGETPCLGVCAGGPIVVVYPEGVWYAAVTPQLLERIVVEHLRDGRVVEEAVFHRLSG